MCLVSVPAQAESSGLRIGIGAAYASPVGGPSLFLEFNDQWSSSVAYGATSGEDGAQAQINYKWDGAARGYLTTGGGRADGISVVRAGYGIAWQSGPLRWHFEATFSLPFDQDDENRGLGAGLDSIAAAFPIGLGVHYVFGGQ